ncbi:hypothetical protein FQZ97_661010 [compost metagenome]
MNNGVYLQLNRGLAEPTNQPRSHRALDRPYRPKRHRRHQSAKVPKCQSAKVIRRNYEQPKAKWISCLRRRQPTKQNDRCAPRVSPKSSTTGAKQTIASWHTGPKGRPAEINVGRLSMAGLLSHPAPNALMPNHACILTESHGPTRLKLQCLRTPRLRSQR